MTETGAKRRGMFFQTRRLALKLNRLALSPFWYGTHGHHVRVLLVQDNPADVVLLRYGLEQAEAAYDLQVGTEGEEAASILVRLAPRIAVAPI